MTFFTLIAIRLEIVMILQQEIRNELLTKVNQ